MQIRLPDGMDGEALVRFCYDQWVARTEGNGLLVLDDLPDYAERQFGAEHPDVATSLNNLAGLYESQGRYSEAEPLSLRALAIFCTQLGAKHPHTQTVFGNLKEFLRQTIAANRTAELSDHSLTQNLLQQLQTEG